MVSMQLVHVGHDLDSLDGQQDEARGHFSGQRAVKTYQNSNQEERRKREREDVERLYQMMVDATIKYKVK